MRPPRGGSMGHFTVGLFLFYRILRHGRNLRFDGIRTNPPRFLAAFVLQAVWVAVCSLLVAALNALPLEVFDEQPCTIIAWLSDLGEWFCYCLGLWFEITVDWQKEQWLRERRQGRHNEELCTRGYWSRR
ncbi:hypothetical protein VTI74DRAFT_1253 [Chaetomium olivicolor]